jgi:hypothetical protein
VRRLGALLNRAVHAVKCLNDRECGDLLFFAILPIGGVPDLDRALIVAEFKRRFSIDGFDRRDFLTTADRVRPAFDWVLEREGDSGE